MKPIEQEDEVEEGADEAVEPQHPFNALSHRFPDDNLTVLAHFYRGELNRSIAWRQKMDMTTHWSILTVTAMVSVSFSSSDVQPYVLTIGSVLVYLLLHVEGRRYRYFDVWRTRVRMLEVHLLVPSVAHHQPILEGDWRKVLTSDLVRPTFKISYWEAIGRRLWRNYVWLFALLLCAWVGKAIIARAPGETLLQSFAVRTHAGEVVIHEWFALGAVFVFHAFLVGLMVKTHGSRTATGEIRRRDPHRKEWPI